MTQVVIVGGGIAGTVTAMALQQAGLDAAVYEAYPGGGKDAGAFLTVGANGMLALAQINATQPVIDAGFPVTAVELGDENGQPIGVLPLGGASPDSAPGRRLRRADLYRALQAEATRRGIPITHGARLTDAHVDGSGVHATFANGSTATGDLLIGADGLRSTVRTVIDPTAPPPRYAGQRVFYGCAPDAAPPTTPAVLHMIRGKKAFFGYTVSPAGETWWFARVSAPKLTREQITATAAAAWRTHLVELFRRDRTPAADIIAATGPELFADNIHDLPGLPTWHAGPILVVGDAAHAASPASGQGASMALEDAIMLAKSLRDLPHHTPAFTAYELLRRTRVGRIIAGGARLTHARAPNAIQRAISNYRARKQLARPTAGSGDWLTDYPIGWDHPVTMDHAAATAAAQRPMG